MSSDPQEQIFKSISIPEEIRVLVQAMLAQQVEILCKLPQERIVKVQVSRLEKNELVCRVLSESAKILKADVICSFSISGEKHFFTATLQPKTSTEVLIILPTKFFVLQRRQNYRLRLPESYQAVIQVLKPGGIKPLAGRLIDLSVGGCRASFDLEDLVFSLDQDVRGQIQVKGRDPIDFTGVIRHLQEQTVGVEFVPFSPALESRVFALTMDLHKELFSRLK